MKYEGNKKWHDRGRDMTRIKTKPCGKVKKKKNREQTRTTNEHTFKNEISLQVAVYFVHSVMDS